MRLKSRLFITLNFYPNENGTENVTKNNSHFLRQQRQSHRRSSGEPTTVEIPLIQRLVRQQQASTAANSEETSCQKRNSSNPLEKDSQIQKLSDEGGESPQQNSSRPPSNNRRPGQNGAQNGAKNTTFEHISMEGSSGLTAGAGRSKLS